MKYNKNNIERIIYIVNYLQSTLVIHCVFYSNTFQFDFQKQMIWQHHHLFSSQTKHCLRKLSDFEKSKEYI